MKLTRYLAPLLAGLIGGAGGSALMLATVPHDGTNFTIPAAAAAGEDDQQRIIAAVRKDAPSVVALNVVANGKQIIPSNPFGMFFGMPSGQQLVPFRELAS